jgi:hypothetical protein
MSSRLWSRRRRAGRVCVIALFLTVAAIPLSLLPTISHRACAANVLRAEQPDPRYGHEVPVAGIPDQPIGGGAPQEGDRNGDQAGVARRAHPVPPLKFTLRSLLLRLTVTQLFVR